MERKQKITIKDILINHYDEFKNRYWFRVSKNMRKHIDDTVKKFEM